MGLHGESKREWPGWCTMRPIRQKYPDVKVSSHAWVRWKERAGDGRRPKSPRALAAVVSSLLYNALGQGVEPDADLVVKLEMGGGIVAIVVVDPLEGWVVRTFIREGEAEEKAG